MPTTFANRLKRAICFAVTAVPLTPVRWSRRWEWRQAKTWQKTGSAQWPRR
ncbi:MAG: hypothetical protein KC442_03270 [Thermomicrobiales bacterium]|nr:hypothetical protein [Thermomicrobiales bacterium]